MVLIKILDHLDRCYTSDDGQKLFAIIKPLLDNGQQVKISFDGVGGVPSSFVNAAFIQLLDTFTFGYIKTHVFFADTIKPTNDMIKKRFRFEVLRSNEKKAA